MQSFCNELAPCRLTIRTGVCARWSTTARRISIGGGPSGPSQRKTGSKIFGRYKECGLATLR
jgi:hypothetical protein